MDEHYTLLYILTSVLYIVRNGHRLAQIPVAANPQSYLLDNIESYKIKKYDRWTERDIYDTRVYVCMTDSHICDIRTENKTFGISESSVS